jgi:hypothetical protein
MKPTILEAIIAAAVIYSADAKKDKDVVVVTVDATLDVLSNTSPTYAPTTSTYAPTTGEPEVSNFFPFALFLSSSILLRASSSEHYDAHILGIDSCSNKSKYSFHLLVSSFICVFICRLLW